MKWMSFDDLGSRLGKDDSFGHFLDAVVETSMPDFVGDFRMKYGEDPELEILIGCIDEKGRPRLV